MSMTKTTYTVLVGTIRPPTDDEIDKNIGWVFTETASIHIGKLYEVGELFRLVHKERGLTMIKSPASQMKTYRQYAPIPVKLFNERLFQDIRYQVHLKALWSLIEGILDHITLESNLHVMLIPD